jgi:RNA polymerase-binding transcription factor DksA
MTTPKLTPADRDRLKAALEARRKALRAEVKLTLTGTGETREDNVVGLRNVIADTDDWGKADAMAALDIAEARHTLAELAEVDAALARVHDGSYGECIDCGVEISPARLFAYPAARRCIACQEKYEVKKAGPPLTAV